MSVNFYGPGGVSRLDPLLAQLLASLGTRLQRHLNLSDLTDPVAARTALSLGGAAILNVGATAGTLAAGDDVRLRFGELIGEATSEQQVTSSAAVGASTPIPGLGLTVDHDGVSDLLVSFGGTLSGSLVSSIPTYVLLRNGVATAYAYGGTIPVAGWFVAVHSERAPLLAPGQYSWTVGLANAGVVGTVSSFNSPQTPAYLRIARV